MATEEHSIRVSVDSTDVTRAERSLNSLTSATTQTERALNSTSSAARSSAAALSGLGASSAGVHSMTAAMSSYSRSATQAAANTQSAAREITSLSSSASRSSDSMRSLSSAISLIGLGSFAKDVLNTNIEMENLRARLDATFGSMAKGQKAFEDILRIAKETPQSVEEISKSFVMLKNFGIEPTIKVMQDLTNLTSKVGGNADTLSGIVRGLGQAYAKGKLQAEEANQMIERGVPVYSLLSKELHKTTAEIMDMMTKGELTRPVIEKLIAAMGDSSVGASTKMMETLGGKISMLGDSWHQFENALLGDKSEGLIKTIVDGWSTVLDGFTARMNQSISGQIVDLKAKLNDAENRKSFISKGMQAVGILDTPEQIKTQIAGLQQKRLADFQTNRQYEQSQKQEKATQAEADAIAKKTKANEEFTKKFGTASQREKQEIDDLKGSMGELTKAQLAQVHAKYFSSQENKSHAASIKEVNKEQSEYQRLIESTPYGEYNATIDKLTEGLKRGGEAFRATYSTGIDEANKKLLDSTQYIKDHTTALKEQQQALEGTARGKFEKGYSELMTQKPYMSDTEYSAGQDKLNADYLTQQQGVDFKTPAEQGKEALKAFNDEMDNTSKAFDKLGNSGSMAFDGILGGISAVAGAASSFATEIIKISDKQQASQEKYDAVIKSVGVTESEKADATKKFAADKIKLDAQAFSAEISGARQIAGATAKLFGEKSAARKAFHAIEMGMSVIEMAMAAKKMIVDVAAGAANMFAQGGFAGFAGVAAMAAVMGGLGFAMSGSSKDPKDMRALKETGTTGTVLGDSEKSSNSIDNSLTILNDTGNKQLLELKDLNSNFTNLVKGVDKTVAQAVSLHGSFTPSTQGMSQSAKNPLGSGGAIAASLGASIALGATGAISTAGLYAGAALINAGATSLGIGISTAAATSATMAGTVGAAMGATGATATMIGGAVLGLAGGLIIAGLQYGLGKLLGIGKTKFEAIGNGIITGIAEMTEIGMKDAVIAYDYSTVKATTKGWFSDTKKIYDVINGVNNEMSKAFTELFGSLGKTLYSAFNSLGIADLVQKSAVVPMMKFDLSKAKTDQEISDVMTKAINTMSDKLAAEIAGGLFETLQKSGEGMLETITRVSAEVANVSAGFARLGISMQVSGMAAIGLSDALVSLYSSAPNATDGLKNFISAMSSFIDTVLTPLQKFKFSSENWTMFSTGFNKKTGLNLNTNIANLTHDEIMAAYTATTEKLRVASEAEAIYTRQQQTVKNATNPVTATDLANQLNAVWKPIIGNTYESATWQDIPANWKTIIESRAVGGTDKTELYQEMKRVFDANTAKSTSAKQVLGEGFNLQQFEESMAAAKNVTADAAESVAALTNSVDLLKAAFDFENKTLSIQENVLKKITSEREATKRLRDVELSQIDNEIDIRTKLNKTTVNAFDAWNKANGNIALTQNSLQKFNNALEDTDKSLKKLSEGSKYLMDFSLSIDTWVKNIRATTGSPVNQLGMAKANFEEQLKLAKFGATAEEKRSALSGITGYADTYMNAIKSYYATSEEGQKAIEDIMSQVSGLGQSVDVQELQLGALNEIKDGIYEIPKGISDANKKLFNDLVIQMNNAGESAKFNPTIENQLRYDALATIVLMIDKSAKSGADAIFIDKLIASAAGKDSLKTNVNLIINSAEFDAAQKTAIISNVLASFNEKRLVLNNFEFDVKDAIDAAKMQITASLGGAYASSKNVLPKKESYQLMTLSQAQADELSKIPVQPRSSTPIDYSSIHNMGPFLNSTINAEAAVPLPDGRSIPVTLYNSANDSSVSSEETIAELKAQNNKLEVLVNTLMATSKAEREKTQELIDAMNGLRSDTRLAARG